MLVRKIARGTAAVIMAAVLFILFCLVIGSLIFLLEIIAAPGPN